MREILFRAKRIDNGEWVEGWYQPPIVGIHCDGRKESLGASLSIIGNYGFLEDVYIIPETVGQFTGLTDKNGKKIFEGDIIKHYNRDDNPTSFDVGRVFWDSTKCRWLRTSQKCDYNPEMWSSSAKGYVIIGNIHDNPELLEVIDNV